MESITVGQVFTWLTAIAGAIGSIVFIVQWIKKIFTSVMSENCKVLQKGLDDLKSDIENTNASIASVNMNYIKSFLVAILSSAERGEHLTDIEKLRFTEEYDYYRSHDGNSYIKEWYEKLHSQGLI